MPRPSILTCVISYIDSLEQFFLGGRKDLFLECNAEFEKFLNSGNNRILCLKRHFRKKDLIYLDFLGAQKARKPLVFSRPLLESLESLKAAMSCLRAQILDPKL